MHLITGFSVKMDSLQTTSKVGGKKLDKLSV